MTIESCLNIFRSLLLKVGLLIFALLFTNSCTHTKTQRETASTPKGLTCHNILSQQQLSKKTVKCEQNKSWKNYGKTVHNHPAVYIQPTTEDEVIKIVSMASKYNWQVRPVGSGHSWSFITKTDDILMGTHRLVKDVIINPNNMTATVGAGHKLQDLANILEKNGYTLPNFGSIQKQTIAGAVSTNTHGTGLTHTGFAGGATQIRIVDGRGKVHIASPTKNKNLFYSALSGAGMLGVITEVTTKIEPKFNIYAETQPATIDELFFDGGHGVWEKVARENEWFSILWVLNTNWATVFSGIKATSKTLKPRGSNPILETLNRNLLAPFYSSLYVHNRGLLHRFIPPLYRIQRWAQPRQKQFSKARAAITKSINPTHWAWNLETEFFFPVKYLPEFVFRMQTFLDEMKKEGIVPAAPMLGFRFVKGDHSYLSPTYIYNGHDEFVALSVFDHNKKSINSPYTEAVKDILEDIVRDKKLLRMHIGKIYKDHPNDFWKRFTQWKTFKATRNKYDPKGIFLNPWTRLFFDEWSK